MFKDVLGFSSDEEPSQDDQSTCRISSTSQVVRKRPVMASKVVSKSAKSTSRKRGLSKENADVDSPLTKKDIPTIVKALMDTMASDTHGEIPEAEDPAG